METSDTNKTTISVILPVYNAEPWIDNCINSLKKQNLHGLEFIFVDDCSTDGSLAKIKSFADEDSRVRILQNETNSGSGPSRNRGIEAAKGEYLSFIDPDDWVSDDFYELLYSKALETDCDIVKGVRISAKIESDRIIYYHATDINKLIAYALRKNTPLYYVFTAEHQSAIYKRSLVINGNTIRYGTSGNAQDTTFLLKLCLETDSISFEENAKYYYYLRSGSATGGFTLKRALEELKSLEEKIDVILDYPLDDHAYGYLGRRIKFYATTLYIASINGHCSDDEKDSYIESLKAQIERIPDKERLSKDNAYVSAILEYGEALPAFMHNALSLTDCLNAWIDFLNKHMDAKKVYSKECANTFAWAWGNSILNKDKLTKTHASPSPRSCINRLNRKKKREVLSLFPTSILPTTAKHIKVKLGIYG